MDDLERGLRDLLTDERLDVPLPPGALASIRDGVRRRRRNRTALMATSTAAVTVLAIGGAVLSSGPGGFATVQPGGDDQPSATPEPDGTSVLPPELPTAGNEIEWNPIAYDAATPFALPGTVPDPSVPWCSAKDLTVAPSDFQGAGGSAAGAVRITNSGDPCAVQGAPAITGYAGDEAVALPRDDDAFVVHPWITLQNGQSALSVVQIFGDTSPCLDPITRLAVGLGHGPGSVPVDATWAGGGPVQPRCGTVPRSQQIDHYIVSAGAWARPGGGPRLPMQDLASTTGGAPTSVMQGTTIRYQVLLSTHGTDLDPCPPYREQLVSTDGTATAYATHYYLLDCTTISNVDASTYRLDVELAMPGDVPPGDYLLEWRTPIPGVYSEDDPTVHVTAAPPACEQQQLDITGARSGAAGMSYYDRVLLTNVSGRTCSLRGYPGIEFVDEAGHPLPTRPEHVTTRPYETVVLDARGGVASFLLVGSDMGPNGGAEPCPATKGVRVIAPNLAEQVLVPDVAMDCEDGHLLVYPVVAGAHAAP